jgi:hypothetical protein
MPLTRKEASYIAMNAVGCRFGTNTNGAAYGFTDLVGEGKDGGKTTMTEIKAFLLNPDEFQPRWDNRLWNTCGVILGLADSGTVLLLGRAPPTAERYNFLDTQARGDGWSFRKCNQVANADILASVDYGHGMTVQDLFDALIGNIRRLAGVV